MSFPKFATTRKQPPSVKPNFIHAGAYAEALIVATPEDNGREAGFSQVRVEPLLGADSMVIGTK
ncbi:hypothetical protein [Cupriavidus taiwanensis]|uniref:hypothetical protein n=1 Tax=Cupriavidus taiwanensis TaxID=164546 RepID=UPI0011AE9448|nr:hypothetical protein [Cupriavidus taiwanensis]